MATKDVTPILSKAKSRMMMRFPFYAAMIMQMRLIPDASLDPPTACTNGKHIWYHPEFIASIEPDQVMFVLVHEAMHVMLMHALRRGGRDAERWNIACDHAVNLMCKAAGLTMFPWVHCDKAYEGKSAEQIYKLLPSDPRDKRLRRPGQFGPDDLRETMMTEADRQQVESEARRLVSSAAQQTRMVGKLPAELERLLEGIVNPPQPWNRYLGEYMNRLVYTEENWLRRDPRRRNFWSPSFGGKRMGEITCGLDVSGSVSARELRQAEAEFQSAMETLNPERIRVIHCDAAVRREEVFEEGDRVVLHPLGGGGTDMRVILEHAEQYDPLVFVLITDCWTPWPDKPTPFPLIVVSTSTKSSPPWAQRIEIDP